MLKQEVYQIAGSNIENLGSDLEKKIKTEAAKHENAWNGVGNAPGLRIWRIEKFHIRAWPEKDYGSFFSGDSYIILNTWKNKETNELKFDLHFWLGQNTTLDEAGTAAYKTVELDTFLGDKPVQHREVEGYESPMFMNYFPHGIFTLQGGVDSGFFHVVAENYPPRLLQVKGCFKHVHTRQVPFKFESLNDGDVFIVDLGNKLYQWNGQNAGVFEKHKAAEVVNHIKEKRDSIKMDIVVIDQDSQAKDPEFWKLFGGRDPKDVAKGTKESDIREKKQTDIKLFRLSDRTGNLTFDFVEEGHRKITPGHFKSDDVYLLDKGYIIYVWIGKDASSEEKRKAMIYAQKFIQENHENMPLPITVMPESNDVHALEHIIKEKL
jgi:gelsolin